MKSDEVLAQQISMLALESARLVESNVGLTKKIAELEVQVATAETKKKGTKK